MCPYFEPCPYLAPKVREFWLGLDLGQASDYSALAILEKNWMRLTVNHLERLHLGMSYPDQVNYINSTIHREPLRDNRQTLVADYTGVGRPVIDMLLSKGLDPVALSIHGGDRAIWSKDGRIVKTPKRDLASCLQVLAQDNRLKIAKNLQFGPILAEELANFRVKIDIKSGHDSYGSWRENEHDDLVLAVAIAAWASENHPRPRAHARFVANGGDVEDFGRDS